MDDDWRGRAACDLGTAGLFDDQRTGEAPRDYAARVLETRAICRGCPVLIECRHWALHELDSGFAGGFTAAERENWRTFMRLDLPRPDTHALMPPDVLGRSHGDRSARPARRAAIVRLVEQGLRQREIAVRLGITERTVLRDLATAGRTRRRGDLTARRRAVADLAAVGLSQRWIADHLGLTRRVVRRDLGLTRRVVRRDLEAATT